VAGLRRAAVAFPAAISCRNLHHVTLTQSSDGIAQLLLTHKVGKNALSQDMLAALNQAVAKVRADPAVRVLIVSSSVERVFCAGADLKERQGMSLEEVEIFVSKLRNSFQEVASLPFPTIAAVEGAALGGGLELALACDIRVAGANAILGLPETALAIIPGAGGTQRLPWVVGIAKAKELVFTAGRMGSADAERIGLVNRSVPAGEALASALEMAAMMVQNGPVALRMAKAAMDHGAWQEVDKALEMERRCYAGVLTTQDRLEGIQAFLEKRKPVYRGL